MRPRCRSLWIALLLFVPMAAWAEKPCDEYPPEQYQRCRDVWTQINRESEAEVAHFGLAQQRRREAGEITQQQHIAENFAFIEKNTQKRLKLLRERMTAPGPPARK